MGDIIFIRRACLLILCLCFFCVVNSVSWARQIVTDDVKSWARDAISQEKTTASGVTSNSIAVLYFSNNTGLAQLDLLQKGICVMLMTDLAKIKGFQVLERAKLQALIEELKLSVSGIVEPETASRLGYLLGAEHLVGGDILKEEMSRFRLQSDLVNVSSEEVYSSPETEGQLLDDIFRMEKDLLFKVVKALDLKLTQEEEDALRQPLTTDLEALLYLFEGIEYSDQGQYDKARKSYENALLEDPDFWLARDFLEELQDTVFGSPEAYSEPGEGISEPPQDGASEVKDQEDPRDRDLADQDNDNDGFTENEGDCDDNNPSVHPGGSEIAYDGIDQDCSGQDLVDVDGDGFAASQVGGTDCDDNNPSVNPATDEVCNGIDDNCNSQIDEGVLNTYWEDADGDGYGNPDQVIQACILLSGSVENNLDCNDDDAQQNPGAYEQCNGIDDDCDGEIDEGCQYLLGGQPPIVDIGSVNQAEANLASDALLNQDVQNGEYVPGQFDYADNDWGFQWTGPYIPGLQVVGAGLEGEPRVFIDSETLSRINGDVFLAYVVQLEEDRLNREIFEMKRRSWQADQVEDIAWQLQNGDIRTRDDYLMQQADAQAGRVLKDRNGDWVRVQQYVLRHEHPNAQGVQVTSIQVLNVSLRGGNGPQAGLSTLDFTTNLSVSLADTVDLRSLPWSDWLNTYGPQLPESGTQERFVYSSGGLDSMYVEFISPSGGRIKEFRSFGPVVAGEQQYINQETMELALGGILDGVYHYTTDWKNAGPDEYWVFPDQDFIYTAHGTNPAPFYYMYRYGPYNDNPSLDQIAPLVMTDLYVIGDSDTAQNRGVAPDDFSNVSFTDVWDCMRVNEGEGLWIGVNNLEMVFKAGFEPDAAIDVIYIPMSRMLWKTGLNYTPAYYLFGATP